MVCEEHRVGGTIRVSDGTVPYLTALLDGEPARLRAASEVPGLLAEEEGELDRAWKIFQSGRTARHDSVFPADVAAVTAGLARLACRRGDIDAVRELTKVYEALGMNGEHYALYEWMKK